MNISGDKAEDLILVQECLNGDKEAFNKLIKKYELPIYNLAFRMMGSNEEALDAAQESFLRAYKALKSFRLEYSFFTWLYTISINVCRNCLKRKKILNFLSISSSSKQTEENNHADIELPDNRMNPEIIYEEKKRSEIIQTAIMKLPDKYKGIVIARYVEGLAYEEIAKIENIPLGTVKTQIHRAKKILIRHIKNAKKMHDDKLAHGIMKIT
ncbi:sigma-70 family RNA polymerase sigma factor [Candidatus Desantisbacteria bacterium]|nr:sigma-70 family RNA polymerase sigma factor [Candidatus Desantisbacteria bacterium]